MTRPLWGPTMRLIARGFQFPKKCMSDRTTAELAQMTGLYRGCRGGTEGRHRKLENWYKLFNSKTKLSTKCHSMPLFPLQRHRLKLPIKQLISPIQWIFLFLHVCTTLRQWEHTILLLVRIQLEKLSNAGPRLLMVFNINASNIFHA
ncbi:hypothetical protein CEXT_789461 [Caerostris extrusa]|uniref:Uncharacterized protein n=1 Tax=Caerostris extrusa TaxID=172846 RepID=A0AAV4XME1_CAEEX|nr:hypothetical protein CEXT_789461 [Caerostris extrusa]